MKKWLVELPITGYVLIEDIEADTREQAIEKAFEMAVIEDIQEWAPCANVTRGNVSYAVRNSVYVEELEDDGE